MAKRLHLMPAQGYELANRSTAQHIEFACQPKPPREQEDGAPWWRTLVIALGATLLGLILLFILYYVG